MPLKAIYDKVEKLAAERGVKILESELIGLVPNALLLALLPNIEAQNFDKQRLVETQLKAFCVKLIKIFPRLYLSFLRKKEPAFNFRLIAKFLEVIKVVRLAVAIFSLLCHPQVIPTVFTRLLFLP